MSLFQKVVRKYARNLKDPCPLCGFKSCAIVTAILGIVPLKLTCTHDQNPTFRVEKSPIRLVAAYAIALLIFLSSLYDIIYTYDAGQSFWHKENMTAVGKFSFGFNLFLTLLCLTYHNDMLVQMLKDIGIMAGFVRTFDEDLVVEKMRLLKVKSDVYAFTTVLMGFFGAYDYWRTGLATSLTIVLKTCIYCACIVILMLLLDGYVMAVDVIYERTLRILTENRASSDENNLERFLTFRLFCYQRFGIVNKYLNPGIIIYVISMYLICHTTYYVALIRILEFSTFDMTENSSITFLFMLVLLLNAYVGVYIQRLADYNDKVLSEIYRMPLSKLSECKRYQVEYLLTSLHVQHFEIKLSSMATLSQRFMVTAFYLSITYVLVAFQFYYQAKHSGTTS